jgi:hypothetical protein
MNVYLKQNQRLYSWIAGDEKDLRGDFLAPALSTGKTQHSS